MIPFDQPEIRVIIGSDLCFAGLENSIYSSASSSDSIFNPRISRDELAVNVVKTRSNSVHLNPLPLIYSDQGTTSVHRHLPVRDAALAVLWQTQETNGSAGFGGQNTSGREIAPAIVQVASQQQRMKDCNAQASGMTGDSRKQFMSSCLSGATETKGPHCTTENRAANPASRRTRSPISRATPTNRGEYNTTVCLIVR